MSWSRIWLVASGCTDRTVEIARRVARADARLAVVEERERRGKSAAIREVLRRAEGDSVVLLNSDAIAEPDAVAALLAKGRDKPRPYAVMARPVVVGADDDWGQTMRWMWDLHHTLHAAMLANGDGAHLSDELLMVSLPAPSALEEGVINDGSFLAVWLAMHAGGCWYAPESRVAIDVPRTRTDHLWQRRRIHVGNAQVHQMLGRPPTTLPRFLLDRPRSALRAVRSMLSGQPGARHLVRLAFWEGVAHALAAWDRAPPARDHVRWRRIRAAEATPGSDPRPPPQEVTAETRLASLLRVAGEFGTGIPLPELAELLPEPAPRSPSELARWLDERSATARVVDGRVYAADAVGHSLDVRRTLGDQYVTAATEIVNGPLRIVRPWIRYIGVSGSTAYREPLPGDDLDFFVVCRSGSLWWFLGLTYLALRLRGRGGSGRLPLPCFNYVLDDAHAPAEFAARSGYLFARESLSVRSIAGDPYYRGLLAGAPWIGDEIPRLYASRTRDAGPCAPAPAPLPVRIANAFVFPWLAAYLQMTGMRRAARTRSRGDDSPTFRTSTAWGRLAFSSRRFERIREGYDRRDGPSVATDGVAPIARMPNLR